MDGEASLPGSKMERSEAVSAKRIQKSESPQPEAGAVRLYTLEVSILGGPMTEKFMERNPVVSRTIQIRGDQTLEDLHDAIYDAMDRFDEHMYEFQFGKKPCDRNAKRYVMPEALDTYEPDVAGTAAETSIDALGLKVRQVFFYWFDFGDDWWHKIKVAVIDDEVLKGKYPKVVKRVGKSPPQYPDEE